MKLGGLRAAATAVALASLVSACAANGGSALPGRSDVQSTARRALVFVTPTPVPTATPVPGTPGTLAWACGGDERCHNIRLVGVLDATLKKNVLAKYNDATFAYHDLHGHDGASCEGVHFHAGDGDGDRDDDFSKFANLPFALQVAGPTFIRPNATTLADPCKHERDDDSDGDGAEHGSHDAALYIATIGFSSSGVTFQALSGPAQHDGDNLVFPASGIATLQPATYAFFVVRNTKPNVVLPTPSAAPPGSGGGLHL